MVIYTGDNGIREPYGESARLPVIIRAPGRVPDPGAVRRLMALNPDLVVAPGNSKIAMLCPLERLRAERRFQPL